MATRKVWIIKFVAGNPAMFTKVNTDPYGPYLRNEAIAVAMGIGSGWRVWIEHVETGKRIYESEAEIDWRGHQEDEN